MKRWMVIPFLIATASAAAQSGPLGPSFGPLAPFQVGEEGDKRWQEVDAEPPAFPKTENLIEFYVSAATANKYFIDASTLSIGGDEVVRYVLVVRTSGGATNVSFEGMHCKEVRWKHYATGSSDGTWTKSRAARIDWRPIENKPVNRHHAALSRDLFCPQGNPIITAEEGRNALRLGKHPNSI
jgi:hypothetical protein